METLNLMCRVFSPRWGREDRYELKFTRSELTITLNGNLRKAILTIKPGEDPEWSGGSYEKKHALDQIFNNDGIYAPTVIPFAIEWAYKKWLDGAMEEDVKAGIDELFEWISSTAHSAPKHEFWRGSF